jgi:hypothetical protein
MLLIGYGDETVFWSVDYNYFDQSVGESDVTNFK